MESQLKEPLMKHLATLFLALALLPGAAPMLRAQAGDPAPPPEAEAPAFVLEETNSAAAMLEDQQPTGGRERSRRAHSPPVIRFGDAELAADRTAEAFIVIGGNALVRGEVNDAVVAIGGNIAMAEGARCRSAVAVIGNIAVENGAKVRNEAVAVGGRVKVEEGGIVSGQIQDLDLGGIMPSAQWLQDWVRHCLFKMRLLSFKVGWAWGFAGIVFLFYALVTLIFQRPLQVCVEEINRRPATTFLLGVLTQLLAPVVFVLLAITGIGAIIIPFIVAALFLGSLVGKVAILQWMGLSAARPFNPTGPAFSNPFVALLLGSVVVCVIYLVPILGLIAWMVFSVWGLGVGVLAAFGSLRREIPPSSVPPQSLMPAGYTPAPPPGAYTGSFGTPEQSASTAASAIGGEGGVMASPLPGTGAPPLIPEALAFPRAGFWERMAAGLLDIVLVSVLSHFVGGSPWGYVLALAYFAGLWAWRGTTIGGIIVGLKVARLDGQRLNFSVALVRALGAAFSIIVLFLGFLNITWDIEKQAWHDRIAGTVVVKLPRGTPLLML